MSLAGVLDGEQLDLLALLDEPAPAVVDVLHLARHALWGWKLQWALHSPVQRRALVDQMHGSGGTCDSCGYWEHDARAAECAMRTWAPPGVKPVRATVAALLRLVDQHAAARPDVVREAIAAGGFLPGAAHVADRFWAPLDQPAADSGGLAKYPDVVKGFRTCPCGHSLLHHQHRGPISAPMADCIRCSCPGAVDLPAS